MKIAIEIDGDYSLCHELFDINIPSIPLPGTSANVPGNTTITLTSLIEHRHAETLATYALILGIAANISNLITFSSWLYDKLASAGKQRKLRVGGKDMAIEKEQIAEALKKTAEGNEET